MCILRKKNKPKNLHQMLSDHNVTSLNLTRTNIRLTIYKWQQSIIRLPVDMASWSNHIAYQLLLLFPQCLLLQTTRMAPSKPPLFIFFFFFFLAEEIHIVVITCILISLSCKSSWGSVEDPGPPDTARGLFPYFHTGLVLTPRASFTDLSDCRVNAARLVFRSCPSRFATLDAQFLLKL